MFVKVYFSVAVRKYSDQNQLTGEDVYFSLKVTFSHLWKPRKGLQQRQWSNKLLLACLSWLPSETQNQLPRVAPPTVAYGLHCQLALKKMFHRHAGLVQVPYPPPTPTPPVTLSYADLKECLKWHFFLLSLPGEL